MLAYIYIYIPDMDPSWEWICADDMADIFKRMFWVRKFNTHFVCRVLWQETCWYKIQLILPPQWNSSLPTLLSPNCFSMLFDASTYFSRLAICQASFWLWVIGARNRMKFSAKSQGSPHLPLEIPGSEPFTCPHPPQWKAENRPLQPR